ncbi:MAG: ribonuclease [Betaproteobacteria bacterium HGW-Betaproteobacteria-13]|jgi:guanyl-specific ribonuclease Sa|uniref:Ribonuclease n=1 Tax=Parazoarcus communis TaxID=41977 RepID=A0A2U8H1D9_9RHOO|nr:ribonuclease domain-containing protein [Parazoarcus communis]AWI79787.1 ribonuclease [Parazoarcus communis]PKO57732.1 MAG: ribonuclease [Betaproteobacteria bacterium HGW-Betaproteobacteria-19]PKO79318.1 MAG: ribonuclease [Betaproteobacteria bacterium HGW-Betaproteobacteria-13]
MTLTPFLSTLQRAARILPLLFLLAACTPTGSNTDASGLPPEAITTLSLIQNGGPFPYRKDGTVFQNRERLLPDRPRGYYREYTVPTPGARDRGARRIVTGGKPPEVFYYTADHYRSFRRIEPRP